MSPNRNPQAQDAYPDEGLKPVGENDAYNRVCRQVHGHDRGGELLDAIGQGAATVVEHDGRVFRLHRSV
ncbi:MAG TPA: hypothetical protein VJ783_15360 [Pirellulales bacterium]|nr:hypothetical protein [Pirellulales bacterium]